MKYLVKWKIEGQYTVSNADLDISDEEASLDAAQAAIDGDPDYGIDTDSGKLSYEVTEVS